MTQYTDKELLKAFKEGDNPSYAFNLIVRQYQERLYWYVRKMTDNHEDTDDIIQDVFVKAWKNLPNFRGDSGIYTWLYRIATNESITFLKKKNRWSFFSMDRDENSFEPSIEADTSGESGESIERKLKEAIAKLPEKQRSVFILKYYEEKKFSEIAEITGGSVGGLKASYHHAVKKIEKILSSN